MATFGQIDVTAGTKKQRELAQMLMQQMQGSQAAGAAVSGLGLPGSLLGLLGGAVGSPRARFARPSTIPTSLAQLLGPGGFGRADPFAVSAAPGMPIPGRPRPMPGGAPDPSYGGNPIPPAAGLPTDRPSSPTRVEVGAPSNVPGDPLVANGMIPLGNGVYYDPITDVIHGRPTAPPQGSTARGLGFFKPALQV